MAVLAFAYLNVACIILSHCRWYFLKPHL